MKQLKNLLVSFIPRHVRNRTFLRIYHVLALIPVPKKIRKNNYNTNLMKLKNADWDFWTVPSSYIENQNEWSEIMYGMGPHHNMRYSGCEIIATYNARKVLTGLASPESMAKLICEYEKCGAALWGEFGVSLWAIEAYFRRHGFPVTTTDKDDSKTLDMIERQCQVWIATVYNDANDITKQVHTVCITRDSGKGYVLHNAYLRDKTGNYIASFPYVTLPDAISHISNYETKLIYLIGIAAE